MGSIDPIAYAWERCNGSAPPETLRCRSAVPEGVDPDLAAKVARARKRTREAQARWRQRHKGSVTGKPRGSDITVKRRVPGASAAV